MPQTSPGWINGFENVAQSWGYSQFRGSMGAFPSPNSVVIVSDSETAGHHLALETSQEFSASSCSLVYGFSCLLHHFKWWSWALTHKIICSWVAVACEIPWKWKSLSRVWLFVTPWTVACQAPLSLNSPGQNTGVGSPFSSPGDLPNPGIEPMSPVLQADSLPAEPPRKP